MGNNSVEGGGWTTIIGSRRNLFYIDWAELWRYRDLVLMFVHRDYVTYFKQTILGPIWFFVSPIFTTIVYVIVFGNIAGMSTDGVPQIAFYLAGVTLWNYFFTCFNETSVVFLRNAGLLGKVYFPRLIMPLSIVVSKLMQLGIQFLMFLVIVSYYWFQGIMSPTIWILISPLLVLLLAIFSLGLGMIFSSLTVKYRDLIQLLTFGIQLFMYATPVVYPISSMPEKYRIFIMMNPLTPIFEGFKKGFLGAGDFQVEHLAYSSGVILFVFVLGVVIFNKVEKTFVDSI